MWANIFLILEQGSLSKYTTKIKNYKRLKIFEYIKIKICIAKEIINKVKRHRIDLGKMYL